MTLDKSETFYVPAFQDSVDIGETYEMPGLCGEKTVTLDDAPPFLTLTQGPYPVLDDFTIEYGHLQGMVG